tara:strand:- start:907 stop:1398 length:492 start_codon:yes stop_codon:yes gene_type:complete
MVLRSHVEKQHLIGIFQTYKNKFLKLQKMIFALSAKAYLDRITEEDIDHFLSNELLPITEEFEKKLLVFYRDGRLRTVPIRKPGEKERSFYLQDVFNDRISNMRTMRTFAQETLAEGTLAKKRKKLRKLEAKFFDPKFKGMAAQNIVRFLEKDLQNFLHIDLF